MADQFWSNVSTLLHFDGVDAATTFTDETGKIWTANGTAQIDTAQSKFGGASGLFDGVAGDLTTPAHADFNLGTSDFTMEGFIRFGSTVDMRLLAGVSNGDLDFAFIGSTMRIGRINTAWDSQFAHTRSTGVWAHYAWVRLNGVLEMFVGGASIGSVANTQSYNVASSVRLCSFNSNSTYLNGHVEELRLTKGVARYAANFTPPTLAFGDAPIISGTIVESLGVANWHVRANRIDDGTLTATVDTTDGNFSLSLVYGEYTITCVPDQGAKWLKDDPVIVDQLLFPPDPITTPYYYKVTVAGDTGSVEPTWTTTPGTTFSDGTATLECIERLVQPQIHSPVIPA